MVLEQLKKVVNNQFYWRHTMHQLQLIKLVVEGYSHFSYGHIVHLEALLNLFKGGLNSYTREYHPNMQTITELLTFVCEQERRRPYLKEGESLPSVDSYIDEVKSWYSSIVSHS